MSRFAEVVDRLNAVIESRQGGDPNTSYTARLLADKTLATKKFGEEAIETIIAVSTCDPEQITSESADAFYHWLVVLHACGVTLDDVAAKLEAREGTSGLVEKASRQS